MPFFASSTQKREEPNDIKGNKFRETGLRTLQKKPEKKTSKKKMKMRGLTVGTEGIKSEQARTSSRGLVPENENRVSLGKKVLSHISQLFFD